MDDNSLSRRGFLSKSALAAAGLAAGGLAAPLASSAAPRATRTRSSNITLTLWGWWNLRMKIYQDAAVDFMKENPDVKIQVVTLAGGTAMTQKIYSAVAAGTGPSMVKMGPFFFQMRDKGLVAPFPTDRFPDSWLHKAYPNYDWSTYGRYVLPTGSMPSLLVYNKRMFAEAGIKAPPRTWDALIAIAKKLTQRDAKGAITRAGFVPGIDQFAQMDLLYQLGGNIARRTSAGPVATFDTPQMRTVYQFLSDLVFKHKVWAPDFLPSEQAMGTGKAAMTLCESFQVGDWRSSYTAIFPHLAYAPPPTPSGRSTPSYGHKKTVMDLSVMTGRPSDEQGMAFRFLEYLYKKRLDIQYRLLDLIAMAPERRELAQYSQVKSSPTLSFMSTLTPHEHDPVEELDELITILTDVGTKIMVTKQSIPDAMQYGQSQVQRLIAKGVVKYIK